MEEYGGYLLIFDEPKRAQLLEEYVERYGTFTDALSAPDWKLKTVDVCLICPGLPTIGYAALGRRGNKVATAKFLVRFSDFVQFEPPIDFEEIENQLPGPFRQHFMRVSTGDGARVPPKTWSNLLVAINALRPQAANGLDHLERLRKESDRAEIGKGFD